MTFDHSWGKPEIVRHLSGGLWFPRQECWTCGTVRNPITREILHYGSSQCKTDGPVTPREEDPALRRRLDQEIEKLEAVGEEVVRYFDGTVPAHELADQEAEEELQEREKALASEPEGPYPGYDEQIGF